MYIQVNETIIIILLYPFTYLQLLISMSRQLVSSKLFAVLGQGEIS